MSGADELGSGKQAVDGQAKGDATPPLGRFEVVPSKATSQDELYSFRTAEAPPQPDPSLRRGPPIAGKVTLILGVVLAIGVVVLIVLGMRTAVKPKPPAPYIDLGTQRFDAAGLGGRLIARWQDSAQYQLSLDPLEQDLIPGFEAVAENPPLPLSLTIRLRDASGLVACQKEILFPPPAPQGTTPDPAQLLQPQRTPSGDTVQNVAGQDGQIAEIAISGGLPCPLKAYDRLVAWDFSTNFPTVADQDDWLKHHGTVNPVQERKRRAASGVAAPVQHLPTAIEGDDVIVGDNPSRGTVETSGGRVFLLGTNGLHNRGSEWQVFPAAIHFRCEKTGFCILSRANSHTTLQARLLK